ncbi:MAG: hypothetical protein JRJ38_18315 [Deltaproteobacteria bacterium]|nr:hypothetical protein [Deltaproteobacteria bacterium]
MRLAIRRVYEKTEEFKDRYRWRSGVEATMSDIFRATAVRKAVNNGKAAHGGVLPALMHAIYVVKERFLNAWGQLRKIFTLFDHHYGHELIMAA